VITTPIGSHEPAFPLDELEQQVGDLAQFYLIHTGDLTRKLVDSLSPKAAVFNGAAKVFAPDWQEVDDWPKLFYCHESFKTRDTEALASQIWKFASEKDLQRYSQLKAEPAQGIVWGFLGSRALVRSTEFPHATIREELTAPGVPLEWLFSKDQQISGKYNKDEGLFIPDLAEHTLESLATTYGFGNLVLVLIKKTERKKGIAAIYPGIEVEFSLDEISGNDRDLVTDFMEPGQVVAMRLYRDPQGRTRLKMNDIDDDEIAVGSVPVVPNGNPWLLPDRDVPIEEEQTPPEQKTIQIPALTEPLNIVQEDSNLSNPTPHPGVYKGASKGKHGPLTGDDLAAWQGYAKGLRNDIASLTTQIASTEAELLAVFAEKESLKRILQERQRSTTAARRKTATRDPNRSTTRSRRDRWSTNEDWFNEEIRRVWISRYKPQERSDQFPLDFSKYSFGPLFFDSVKDDSLTEDELRKAVRVIVDIVTGRESESRQNRVHALRESESPSAPQRTRDDGSKGWRANIEDRTPQARRLHYWKLPTGEIQLAKIAKHDDDEA
jgi:hypothetical protein